MNIDYENYRKLIYRKSHFVADKYGFEFDEVVGQCNLIFTEAIETYDKSKCSFMTWLYRNLDWKLNMWVRKQTKHWFADAKIIEETPIVYDNPSIINDMMEVLDDDSKRVFGIVTKNPDVANISGADSNFQIKVKMHRHMTTTQGWTRQKTLLCFDLIRDKLNELGSFN
jgi:hypothetical protein